MNEFPVALASDAFVMCFDTVEAEYAKPRNLIWRTLSWANEFQKLRREYKKDSVIRLPDDTTPELTDDCMAPMMVAFTKCRELESEAALREVEMVRKFETDRVKDIYCLKAEREYIDLNPVYQRVGTDIRVYENLKNAYIARLRVSPYGPAALPKHVYLKNNNTNKNDDGSIKVPRPQHIAELMQWLLMITGCVPVPAEYIPNAQDTDRRCRLENVFVRGVQYRILPPQGKTYEEKMNAAMCRAYLFENCSEQDCDIIQRWGRNKTFREKLSEVFRGLTRK